MIRRKYMGMTDNAAVKSGTLRRAPGAALLAFFWLCACGLTSYAGDWPMFRGNPQRTGYVAEQAAPPLTNAWEFQVPGGIVSSPAIYNGVVYIGSRANKIYALDAATGVLRWERLAAGWVDSSPTVVGGVVYVSCLGGRLYALDSVTGAVLWISDLGAASVSSPLVLGGKVYVGTGSPENKLKVYDAATGALSGSTTTPSGQPVDSAPSTDGSSIYFGANDGSVYALSTALNKVWGPYPTLGSFGLNALAVSGDSLYALPGRDEKTAIRLSLSDGSPPLAVSPELTQAGPWAQVGSPVFDGSVVYFAAGAAWAGEGAAAPAQLAALSSAALAAVWPSSRSLGGISPINVLASPAMANDVIYAATPAGTLLAISSSSGQLESLDIFGPAYASPAISNGMVIAANYGGLITGWRAGRHAAIAAPAAGEILTGTVTVTAYFDNTALSGYELEYTTGGAQTLWTRVSSAAVSVPAAGLKIADWDVSDLENGDYTLRLRVLEGAPSGYDCTASVRLRVNEAPQPPSGLSAADVDGDIGNSILLQWSASTSPGVSSYRIYRDAGDGYSLLASAAGISYTDAAAVTGSTFTYAVTAWDGWLESAISEEVEAYSINNSGDDVSPAAVTDLAASTGTSPGSIHLSWTAAGNDGDIGTASCYVIRYSTDPAQDWADFSTLSGSSSAVNGPAGITESEDVGWLLGGVTYYFAVKTVDQVGNEALLSNVTSYWALLDYTPPTPPAGLSIEDTPGDEGGSLTLSWTLSPDDGAGVGDVYGYKIYRRTLDSSYISSAPYAAVDAGSLSYADPDAPKNKRYYYSVAAFDSTNNSALSAEASGVSADNWRFFDASDGGVVRLPDGMEISVPPGSADRNGKIIVTRLDPVSYQPLFSALSATLANPTDIIYEVRFQDADTKLSAPALVSLPYTDADVAGMALENLRLYSLSGEIWTLLKHSSVDTEAKKVRAETDQFSSFRIMEYLPSGAILAENEVYTYPNPAKGDALTFKFRPVYKADVTIDVYNVAGEKVARLEKKDCLSGVWSEIAWQVRGIASGVYVYRLQARTASGKKTVEKKLAIIH